MLEQYKDRVIVIGYPSPEQLDYRFHSSLLNLATQSAEHVTIKANNSVGSRITLNRNDIVDKARLMGATDILWIDSDTVFPVNGLLRLLRHNKDIVCATTCNKGINWGTPIGTPVDELPNGSYPDMVTMKLVGMPFMLTSMKVFDNMARPYFAEPPRKLLPEIDACNDEVIGEDEYFCHYARKAGFEIWCDRALSLEIGHAGSQVYYISQA